MNEDYTLIDRIKKMEQLMDEVQKIHAETPERIAENIEVQEMISTLEEYLGSGQWLRDYECDERGQLPARLKRGVLSQDALYDLLTGIKGISKQPEDDIHNNSTDYFNENNEIFEI